MTALRTLFLGGPIHAVVRDTYQMTRYTEPAGPNPHDDCITYVIHRTDDWCQLDRPDVQRIATAPDVCFRVVRLLVPLEISALTLAFLAVDLQAALLQLGELVGAPLLSCRYHFQADTYELTLCAPMEVYG